MFRAFRLVLASGVPGILERLRTPQAAAAAAGAVACLAAAACAVASGQPSEIAKLAPALLVSVFVLAFRPRPSWQAAAAIAAACGLSVLAVAHPGGGPVNRIQHTAMAALVGAVAFQAAAGLARRSGLDSRPWWLALFAAAATVSLGVGMELAEAAVSWVPDDPLRRFQDTMKDLACDAAGAFIGAAGAWAAARRQAASWKELRRTLAALRAPE